MKLVVFLGNPGLRYRRTRHNVGFMMGDFYAKAMQAKWHKNPKFMAEIIEITAVSEKILLVKPLLFYNLSGQVVKKLADFYKLAASDILVVCDDLNLEFGVIRQRVQGSAGGNNGLKSIIDGLKTEDFARIRIGTDNPLRTQIGDTDFVLSKFSRHEQSQLPAIFQQISTKIDDFVA